MHGNHNQGKKKEKEKKEKEGGEGKKRKRRKKKKGEKIQNRPMPHTLIAKNALATLTLKKKRSSSQTLTNSKKN